MPDLSTMVTEQLISELLLRQRQLVPGPISPGESIVKHIWMRDHEFHDSIYISTPGRGGEVKIYFDNPGTQVLYISG